MAVADEESSSSEASESSEAPSSDDNSSISSASSSSVESKSEAEAEPDSKQKENVVFHNNNNNKQNGVVGQELTEEEKEKEEEDVVVSHDDKEKVGVEEEGVVVVNDEEAAVGRGNKDSDGNKRPASTKERRIRSVTGLLVAAFLILSAVMFVAGYCASGHCGGGSGGSATKEEQQDSDPNDTISSADALDQEGTTAPSPVIHKEQPTTALTLRPTTTPQPTTTLQPTHQTWSSAKVPPLGLPTSDEEDEVPPMNPVTVQPTRLPSSVQHTEVSGQVRMALRPVPDVMTEQVVTAYEGACLEFFLNELSSDDEITIIALTECKLLEQTLIPLETRRHRRHLQQQQDAPFRLEVIMLVSGTTTTQQEETMTSLSDVLTESLQSNQTGFVAQLHQMSEEEEEEESVVASYFRPLTQIEAIGPEDNHSVQTVPPTPSATPELTPTTHHDMFPHLPNVPLPPLPSCMEDEACVLAMQALEPVFPLATKALINVPGTCQHWAREWIRSGDQDYVLRMSMERVRQRYTLALFYCEMSGDHWSGGDQELWISDLHECDWFSSAGIDPCSQDEQYQILRGVAYNMQGTLPPELSMLTNLWEITLQDNLITGTIPNDWSKLTQLDTLSLTSNHLQGSIPNFVWEFPDMTYLDLANNAFTGTLLDTVYLTEPNLQVLLLENNSLTGTIPTTFGYLDWARLHLNGNNLGGPVPPDIMNNAARLEELMLHSNRLTGTLPSASLIANDESQGSRLRIVTLNDNDVLGDVNELCSLFTEGSLEILSVDLDQVSCTCCTSDGSPVTTIPDDGDPFVATKPYEGIVTTPFDPYVENDCNYADNRSPHVISQCECFGSIDKVANDTMQLYHEIRQDINQVIYGGTFDDPVASCVPINQALYWLSSGDNRDAGDLYQRFLMALTYITMNGTKWDLHTLWLSEESKCIWYGLQCDGMFQLNSFALDTNNVHGSIPTEIAMLSSLNTISITRNHVSGTIPKEIFNMPHLENLYLYANQLIGSIPTEIAQATSLKTLRLENNLLFGNLCTEVGQVSQLEELSIGFNEFWQKIPTEMGPLTNMKRLVLEDNRFSGTLPTEFGRMTSLEYFVLSQNLLSGPIPTELFSNTPRLHEFRVANTGLGGTLPLQLSTLTELHRLDVSGNNFQGTLITELGLMTGLTWLALNDNDFSGTIPTEFGNLVNMTRLSFQDNLLTGTIPSELGRMTALESLSMERNSLIGTAPNEVCQLRSLELNTFVTDCYDDDAGATNSGGGVYCPVDQCCTFCRS